VTVANEAHHLTLYEYYIDSDINTAATHKQLLDTLDASNQSDAHLRCILNTGKVWGYMPGATPFNVAGKTQVVLKKTFEEHVVDGCTHNAYDGTEHKLLAVYHLIGPDKASFCNPTYVGLARKHRRQIRAYKTDEHLFMLYLDKERLMLVTAIVDGVPYAVDTATCHCKFVRAYMAA
jgi:hypothetical protein